MLIYKDPEHFIDASHLKMIEIKTELEGKYYVFVRKNDRDGSESEMNPDPFEDEKDYIPLTDIEAEFFGKDTIFRLTSKFNFEKRRSNFLLVKFPKLNKPDLYLLKPFRIGKDPIKDDFEYKKNTALKGGFGTLEIYNNEKIVKKLPQSLQRDGSFTKDHIREIAIYTYFSKTACLANFLGIDDSALFLKKGDSDLSNYNLRGDVDTEELIYLFHKILTCLYIISLQGVIHFDIKPSNIIISGKKFYIIDWGLAEIDFSKNKSKIKHVKGTRGYMAPELLVYRKGSFNEKVDIFSLGVSFLNILRGRREKETYIQRFFDSLSSQDLNKNNYEFYKWKKVDLTKYDLPEDQSSLISHMLDFNPETRYNYNQLLSHRTFKNYKALPKIRYEPYYPIKKNLKEFWGNNILDRREILNYFFGIFERDLGRQNLDVFCNTVELFDFFIYKYVTVHKKKIRHLSLRNIIDGCFSISTKLLSDIEIEVVYGIETIIINVLQGELLLQTYFVKDCLKYYDPYLEKGEKFTNYKKIYMDNEYIIDKYKDNELSSIPKYSD